MGGDPPAPPPNESTAEMFGAFQNAFPNILRIQNEGIVPSAEAQLKANQAVAPGLAALQAQLYGAYGPQMARTADQINAQSQEAQAKSDLGVVGGTGRKLVEEALTTQKLADPEFYKTRESTAGNLEKLFNSINLDGGLSAGENEAISRGLAQQNQSRGIAGNPSQTATVEGAMKFGGAQRAREAQAKDQLTMALQTANQALPAMKSGVDVFQVATGRSSMPNAGDSKFTGVDTSLGNAANQVGANVLNQVGGLVQQKNQINADRRDGLDRFNETFSSVIGSL
jgi:hypothetical protein